MSTARLHLRRGIPIGDRGPMIVCRPSNRGGRAVGIECRRYPRMAHRAHPRHGRREARQKQLRFRAVLNFSRRHCLKIESLAPPAARLQSSANKHCLKGRKPVRGAKEWRTGAEDALRASRNQKQAKAKQFHGRAFSSEIGENPYALPYALSVFAGRRGSNAYGQ